MEVLVNYFSITASIFGILSGYLMLRNKFLRKENERLISQVNYIQQDYSKHIDQIINIKKGDTKRQYDTEHLLKKSFPTFILYLFLFFYMMIGYLVGRNYDVVPQIVSLFLPKIQLSNPEFWIVIITLITLLILPLYTQRRIIKKFPYKAVELPVPEKTISTDDIENEIN
jgi:hypothetical protein